MFVSLTVILLVIIFLFVIGMKNSLSLHCEKCEKTKLKWNIATHEIVDGCMDYSFYKAICKDCVNK